MTKPKKTTPKKSPKRRAFVKVPELGPVITDYDPEAGPIRCDEYSAKGIKRCSLGG